MHLMRFDFTIFITLIFILSSNIPCGNAGGVELHAHLFMKEGMTWMFNGEFNGPIRAKSWKSRFSSQANPETLDQSGLDIVVATLYAHSLCTISLRDSIRKQIKLAKEFVQTHNNWELATNPDEAKSALSSGKHVLILALEGASGVLETEEDFQEFVDRGGIRIVTLLHLMDDDFGGVAFLKGFRGFSSPFAFLRSIVEPHRDLLGDRVNPQGLRQRGVQVATSLIQRKVWIDLAHASDVSQNEIIPLMIKAGQPILYTHTILRKYHQAERGISESQLKKVAETHGIVGLMPSEEMLNDTPPWNGCSGGIGSLATQFNEMAKIVGESSVAMGSDYNGGIPHLKPSCPTGTELDQRGLVHIGQSQQVWDSLNKLGAWNNLNSNSNAIGNNRDGSTNKDGTGRFLDAWSSLWAQSGMPHKEKQIERR